MKIYVFNLRPSLYNKFAIQCVNNAQLFRSVHSICYSNYYYKILSNYEADNSISYQWGRYRTISLTKDFQNKVLKTFSKNFRRLSTAFSKLCRNQDSDLSHRHASFKLWLYCSTQLETSENFLTFGKFYKLRQTNATFAMKAKVWYFESRLTTFENIPKRPIITYHYLIRPIIQLYSKIF